MKWVGGTASGPPDRYHDVVAHAAGTLIALDYDGTLAPLVSEPPDAFIHPAMPTLIRRLCATVQLVAIVTGRPAQQAVDLGGFDAIASDCPNLLVLGQYGNEYWSATHRQVISPAPPAELGDFLADLPQLFASTGITPWIEEKGLAIALHTRRLPAPQDAYVTLLPHVAALASDHGLIVEPGRFVMEARAPGMDKGIALHLLIDEHQPEAVIYVGDDLGDLPAFAELASQSALGMPTLHVCAGSPVEPRVAVDADLIVSGPEELGTFFAHFLNDVSN